MDLNSLPGEILSIVLKRSNPGILIEMRKMNQRIDQVFRRNGIWEKLPVDKLCLLLEHEDIFVKAIPIMFKADENDKSLLDMLPIFKDTSLTNLIGRCCSKLEVRCEIRLSDGEIGEKEFTALMENRHHLLNVTRLELFEVRLELSTERLKTLLLEIFPKLHTITMINTIINQETCLVEALAVRRWKKLNFKYMVKHRYIPTIKRIEFLDKVAMQCGRLRLINFPLPRLTLLETIDYVKKCIKMDGKFNRILEICTIDLGEVNFEDIETTIISNVPGINVEKRGFLGYAVTFQDVSDSGYLFFRVITKQYHQHFQAQQAELDGQS